MSATKTACPPPPESSHPPSCRSARCSYIYSYLLRKTQEDISFFIATEMCRTTDFHGVQFLHHGRRRLCIKSFYIRFSCLKQSNELLPESLTLRYLPRIQETDLLINGYKVKPDSDAFLTLHRVVQEEAGEAIFGSRERVRASEGARFEVYLREEKLFEGGFVKDEEEGWRVMVGGTGGGEGVAVVEVCVAVEGNATLTQRVEVGRRRRRRLGRLEVIPEVDDESGSECCLECGSDDGTSEGGDLEEIYGPDLEGVSWAIDVGIWVVCLGVGFMVSKASAKSMRRLRIL